MAKKQAPKPREWRVSKIASKLSYIGRVTASDREAAEAAAVQEFALKEHERARLLIEEVR